MVEPPIYHPLSVDRREIRILTVHSDLTDGLVSCTLDTVSLSDEDCSYHAVSWCWGDATRTKPVIVDGYVLNVPGNADEVLRKVVIRHGHTKIWVDAICINQADIEERASQVSIMRQVYSQAAKVLIWLGDDDGFATGAVDSVGKIVRHCRDSTDDLSDYESKGWMRAGKRTPRRWFSYGLLPEDIDWQAIRHLFSSPLLCRVWVIQEIALARDPVCFYGQHSFAWKELGISAEWMIHRSYERSQYCGMFVRGIMNGSIICSAKRGGRDLDKLLMTSVHFDCSEPRDKVFGLLGLMGRGEGELIIKPDYKQDVGSVFIDATRVAIDASQSLRILGSARIASSSGSRKELPSWVPVYAETWKRGPKGIRNFSENGADNELPLLWDPHTSNEMLRVKGLPVSTIVAAFGPLDTATLSSKSRMATVVNEIRQLISSLNPTSFASDVLYRVFTTHETKTAFNHGERHVDARRYDAFLLECQKTSQDIHPEPGWSSHSGAPGPESAILDHLRIEALHRYFFVTTDGWAGQSSSAPVVGDTVCILFGSEIPMVLRSVGQKNMYALVGGAYVADLMDGSYVARLQREGGLEAASQWFDIV